MNLPRVLVSVTRGAAEGWTVQVSHKGAPVVPDYTMEAVPEEVDGVPRLIPVVPGDRRAEACWADTTQLVLLLERLAMAAPDEGDVTLYGRWLFECLLAPAWPRIERLTADMGARGVELALDWPATDADLNRLSWEAIHDGRAPLAGHPALLVAITRQVRGAVAAPVTLRRAVRVLFAVGSSLTDEVVRPGALFMGLLRLFDAEGLCVTRTAQDVTLEELGELCAAFHPDVVHIVAHGGLDESGRGVIFLGRGRPGGGAVRAEGLLAALTAGGAPQAVLLNACESGSAGNGAPLAAELVGGGIPIVSAMAGEISEPACRFYTRRIVAALHDGEPIGRAVARGRHAALLRSEHPADQLDWAMPALFLSPAVPAGFRLVDPEPARRIVEIADQLRLRRDPVYIGRREILRLADELFSAKLGFVCAVGAGSLRGLGGTRLLREIGFRLLRSGHVPLLLGPYNEHSAPTSLRGVLVELMQQAVTVAETLDISPPQASVLGADATFGRSAEVAAAALRDLDAAEARVRILSVLPEFARSAGSLDPHVVRHLLAADLAALAKEVGDAGGEPFRPHTRVVVLADGLHGWADALADILTIVKVGGRNGLGNAAYPAPLIATSSLSEKRGPMVKAFSEEHVRGFRFPSLDPLPDQEAALGFQWVLLHPWQHDRGPEFRRVYVFKRGTAPGKAQDYFSVLEGKPTKVEYELYLVAQLLEKAEHLITDDDEAAYRAYQERHG